ncbi:MAG: hypothetical protein HFG16_03100 [Erysipelotrichaceae bacterium]|jgi:hypothetical protein|nr:hypothetical protein [Erysipelotrichaceae bacterium]
MDRKKLENICSSTCFRFIEHELVYPQGIDNMSFMIIYPTDGFYFTKKQYLAIFNVIKKQFNNEYYISDIEFADSFSKEEKNTELGYMHRKYTSFDYDSYIKEILLFEYAIYDTEGLWGISVFQDYYAIICANEKVIKDIMKNYPNSVDKRKFKELLQCSNCVDSEFKEKIKELISKM